MVLPFWYRLTRVVPDKGPLNGCVCKFCFDTSLSVISNNKTPIRLCALHDSAGNAAAHRVPMCATIVVMRATGRTACRSAPTPSTATRTACARSATLTVPPALAARGLSTASATARADRVPWSSLPTTTPAACRSACRRTLCVTTGTTSTTSRRCQASGCVCVATSVALQVSK